MASGTLTSKPDQVTVGEQITLTIAISDFNNNTVALSADNDPGDSADWRTVKLDADGAATVTVTPANAGSYTFTLQIDGSAATDSNGQPITAGPVTVNAPTTTQAPPPTTTQALPTTTTAAPPPTTTQPAPPTTTTAAAPPTTTTAAAPPTTTTAAAPPTTTTAAAPPSTTTAAAAPPSTTTAAAAPPSTTTAAGAPPSTTTAAASGGGPTVGEVTVKIDPDDGADHHAHSIQVATNAKLTLTWSTQNATGVKIDPLGSFGPNESTELPARDASYFITAVDGSGAASKPYLIEIHTHEPGEVVSPHVEVSAGVATIISFGAEANGVPLDRAAPGDSVELKVVATADADSVKVDDQEVTLQDSGDGHKSGSITVTVPADARSPVAYTCKAIKDGQESDPFIFHLTVDAAASSTTTAPPSTTTQALSTTTTAAPQTTTTTAATQTTTTVAPQTTTTQAPTTTTTAAPQTTTTAAPQTTTTQAPTTTTTAAPQTTTTQAPATTTTAAQGDGSLTVEGFLSFSTFMLVDESGTPITIDGKNGITTTAIPFGEQMFMFGADGTAKFDGLPAGKYHVVYPTEQDPADGPAEPNPEPVQAGDAPVKVPIDNLLNTGFVASVDVPAAGQPKNVSIEVTTDNHPSACC